MSNAIRPIVGHGYSATDVIRLALATQARGGVSIVTLDDSGDQYVVYVVPYSRQTGAELPPIKVAGDRP